MNEPEQSVHPNAHGADKSDNGNNRYSFSLWRFILWGSILTLLGMIALQLWDEGSRTASSTSSPAALTGGERVPQFQLRYLGSEIEPNGSNSSADYFDSKQLKGKPWLVNFWASWCPPCREEWPHLHSLTEQGVIIVGVNANDFNDKALAWLQQAGDPFTHSLVNGQGEEPGLANGYVSRLTNLGGLPASYLVDERGVVRMQIRGPIKKESIKQILAYY